MTGSVVMAWLRRASRLLMIKFRVLSAPPLPVSGYCGSQQLLLRRDPAAPDFLLRARRQWFVDAPPAAEAVTER